MTRHTCTPKLIVNGKQTMRIMFTKHFSLTLTLYLHISVSFIVMFIVFGFLFYLQTAHCSFWVYLSEYATSQSGNNHRPTARIIIIPFIYFSLVCVIRKKKKFSHTIDKYQAPRKYTVGYLATLIIRQYIYRTQTSKHAAKKKYAHDKIHNETIFKRVYFLYCRLRRAIFFS